MERNDGLQLTEEQVWKLTGWAKSRTLRAGDVLRAKLILALAQGKSYTQIENELQISRPDCTLEGALH